MNEVNEVVSTEAVAPVMVLNPETGEFEVAKVEEVAIVTTEGEVSSDSADVTVH